MAHDKDTFQPNGPITIERLSNMEERLKSVPACTNTIFCAEHKCDERMANIIFADAIELIALARKALHNHCNSGR